MAALLTFLLKRNLACKTLNRSLNRIFCALYSFCFSPLYDKKTKSVLRENTRQALEKQRKNSFLNFSRTFWAWALWSEAVDFQWIFFKGSSSLKIACQEKAIFNAFLQRKPPLNVERIDASFLLKQNILML